MGAIKKVLNIFLKTGGLDEAKKVLYIKSKASGRIARETEELLSSYYNMPKTNLMKMAKDRIRLETIAEKGRQSTRMGTYSKWHQDYDAKTIDTILKREFGIGRTNKDFYYKYPKSKQNYGMTEAERSKLIEDIGTPFKELMRSKRMRSVKKYVKGKDF